VRSRVCCPALIFTQPFSSSRCLLCAVIAQVRGALARGACPRLTRHAVWSLSGKRWFLTMFLKSDISQNPSVECAPRHFPQPALPHSWAQTMKNRRLPRRCRSSAPLATFTSNLRFKGGAKHSADLEWLFDFELVQAELQWQTKLLEASPDWFDLGALTHALPAWVFALHICSCSWRGGSILSSRPFASSRFLLKTELPELLSGALRRHGLERVQGCHFRRRCVGRGTTCGADALW
jgi:hypothetical protein